MLRYKELMLPVAYTGSLIGHQVYVDEVYIENSRLCTGAVHTEECRFMFEQGKLNIANSYILKAADRFIEPYLWKEEIKDSVINLEEYDSITFGNGMYFVQPRDIFAQNIAIFNCIIAYLRWAISNEEICKQLLAFENPKFKLEYMFLQNSSGTFEKKTMDLIPLIIQRGEKGDLEANELMKKIFKYIDFLEYAEYEDEIRRMVR